MSNVRDNPMQQPNIRTTMKDEKQKITYHVMAYRTLTDVEMLQSIRYYFSQKKSKKLKPGESITIITVIGFSE